jgi:hypothetical protein
MPGCRNGAWLARELTEPKYWRLGWLRQSMIGVNEGRRTVVNTGKYILMASSANFGNIFSMVLAGLILSFLPLLPIQVLLTNLIYDFAQTALPVD